MIKIENLSKAFGKLNVLNNVNLSLSKPNCVALVGPNASGKTTLIKSILGLVIPDSGTICIDGKSILGQWEYRQNIGYMPQIGRYPENMNIGQLINMIIEIRKGNYADCDTELITKFQIEKIYSKRLGTLSGGTRQKISACLALLFHPEIIILDEPTAGLDPVSTEILKEKIYKEKQNNKLVIITSHVLSDLDDLVQEVVFFQDGTIKFQKNIEHIKSDTGETTLSKAIAKVMGYNSHE